MKVKTLVGFTDLKEDRFRKVGEVFDVTKKRFDEINATNYGVLVEEIKEPVKK